MRTGAFASVVSLVIWVVVSGAVLAARPAPPASLFGYEGDGQLVVAGGADSAPLAR